MIKPSCHLLCFWMLCFPVLLFCQQTTGQPLQVEVTIIEQKSGGLQILPNFTISIQQQTFISNNKGTFAFPIQLEDNLEKEIQFRLNSLDYEWAKPFDGRMTIDTSHTIAGLELFVYGKDIEQEYKNKIQSLQRRLRGIQLESNLSTRRLNALNDSLVQIINMQIQEQQRLQTTIDQLKETISTTEQEKEGILVRVDRLEEQLEKEKVRNQQLQEEKEQALAKVLRLQDQNQKLIAGVLDAYLLRIKDVHEQLNYLRNLSSLSKLQAYNATIEAYNEIFIKINDAHEGYIQDVQKSWKSNRVGKDLESTFAILFDQLHYPLLQPSVVQVNQFLGQKKFKKASKYGMGKFEELSPIIRHLENTIKRLNKTMRKTIN